MSLAIKTSFIFKTIAVALMPFSTAIAAHAAGNNLAKTPQINTIERAPTLGGNLRVVKPVGTKSGNSAPTFLLIKQTNSPNTLSSQLNLIFQPTSYAEPSKFSFFPRSSLFTHHKSTNLQTTSTTVAPTTTVAQTTSTTVAPTTTVAQTINTLGYNEFPMNVNAGQGTTYGSWTPVFNGYGSIIHNIDPILGDSLTLTPAVSTASNQTHSALVTTIGSYSNFNATFSYRTIAQLRTGSSPNPWEVGWVLFHYTDNTHFYYFIAKPTGWELGKEDPNYPGNQRFLATGSYPNFPVGNVYNVNVQMSGSTISVSVNGTLVTTFTDNQSPYMNGSIGLYDEDSSVAYAPVLLNP